MAKDLSLYFHGSAASGTTIAVTTQVFGPTVDLGSNTVNRAILVSKRVLSGGTTGTLDVVFQDSTDATTFTNMPGSTGAALGFVRQTSVSSYSSTDAVAADAPARILLRTDKRYVRAAFTAAGTGPVFGGVSIVGDVLGGGFSGAAGPRDT